MFLHQIKIGIDSIPPLLYLVLLMLSCIPKNGFLTCLEVPSKFLWWWAVVGGGGVRK